MKGKYMNITLSCTENEQITDLAKQKSFATIREDAVPSNVLCTGTPQFPVASVNKLQPAKPREVMVFNVKGSKSITGAVFLKDGKILLSDFGSQSVHLCDSSGNVLSTVNVDENCWGVSRLFENTFITTDYNAVVCFVINSNKLNITTRELIGISVRSIAPDIVGGGCVMAANQQLVTIDRNCQSKEKISLPIELRNVTSVCTIGSKIWYGDQVKNSVHCMNREGNSISTTYRDENLKCPRYICSDIQGRIYIAGCNSHNIHQLTSEGELERILLSEEDGLDNPRVVVFQEDSNDTFLVSDNKTRVRIFKLV